MELYLEGNQMSNCLSSGLNKNPLSQAICFFIFQVCTTVLLIWRALNKCLPTFAGKCHRKRWQAFVLVLGPQYPGVWHFCDTDAKFNGDEHGLWSQADRATAQLCFIPVLWPSPVSFLLLGRWWSVDQQYHRHSGLCQKGSLWLHLRPTESETVFSKWSSGKQCAAKYEKHRCPQVLHLSFLIYDAWMRKSPTSFQLVHGQRLEQGSAYTTR